MKKETYKLDSYSKTKFLISLLEKKDWVLSVKYSGSHWRRYVKETRNEQDTLQDILILKSYAIGPVSIRRELRIKNKWFLLESKYISKLDIYDIIALPM